ncbi:MAG: sulfite exporter TauE/SafE family protein [Elusimicrobiota bacterium]|jgi:sulfite exporter TauE/SafE/copper chaperone CopZ|nr:sulfite exporter TauE/SafE family protein [Elusimicrobiota bacterium]
METNIIYIGGMTCINCQNRIEKALRAVAGIKSASVSYQDSKAIVVYDGAVISLKEIYAVIEKLNYLVLDENPKKQPLDISRIIAMLIIILALYIVIWQMGFSALSGAFPTAEFGMGYAMLFVIGLITSFHCIAMCGGINLSQCIPRKKQIGANKISSLHPSLLYNLGRIVSYTIVGAIVGGLGSLISFSGAMRGIVQIAAGIFMVIMGVNMLGLFPFLRSIVPRLPKIFTQKIDSQKGSGKSPLYIGLLNGLMPCGPLQAMQIYALSTASVLHGALSMFFFSLGTAPLMFGLGALSSILSRKFTNKVMSIGAVLVAALGLTMFSQGLTLSGWTAPLDAVSDAIYNRFNSQTMDMSEDDTEYSIENGVQIVRSTLSSGRYPSITVEANIPVKWIIDAPQGSINGCNNRMQIPEYGIEHKFVYGGNIIEFVPSKTGKFRYSCWMGMIRSVIIVTQ